MRPVIPPRPLLLLLLAVALLLAGCALPGRDREPRCGLEAARSGPEGRPATVDDALLAAHPALRPLLEDARSAGPADPANAPVDCEEGRALMEALRDAGADGRTAHDHSHERLVEWRGEAFLVRLLVAP